MTRGGKRNGAGRPRVLTEAEAIRVGRACERVWYWLSGYKKRAYYYRPYVLLAAAVYYTSALGRLVTMRRVEAAWKTSRKLGEDRAQPSEVAYSDAHGIEDYLFERLDSEPSVSELVGLTLEQVAFIHC